MNVDRLKYILVPQTVSQFDNGDSQAVFINDTHTYSVMYRYMQQKGMHKVPVYSVINYQFFLLMRLSIS